MSGERKKTYKLNKTLKVGDELTCPICKTKFIKKQWQQAFCCGTCKDKFWNDKPDRHKDPNYHHNYNMKHPERLERVGIFQDDLGEFGYYNEDDEFVSFREEYETFAMCENPILGL